MTENDKFLKHLYDNKTYEYDFMSYNADYGSYQDFHRKFAAEMNRSSNIVISYLLSLSEEKIKLIFQDNYWKTELYSGPDLAPTNFDNYKKTYPVETTLLDSIEDLSRFYPKLFEFILLSAKPELFRRLINYLPDFDRIKVANLLVGSKIKEHRKFAVKYCSIEKLSKLIDDKDILIVKSAAKRLEDPKLILKVLLKQPNVINEGFVYKLDRETIENLTADEIVLLTDSSRKNCREIKMRLAQALPPSKLLFNLDLCDESTREIFSKKIEIGDHKWS